MEFYELTYIVEGEAQERLSALAERCKGINGWDEKDILQFAVAATYKADINIKLQFLEQELRAGRITSMKRADDKYKRWVKDKIFKKKQSACQTESFELTYIMDDSQKEKLSELAESYKKINGWDEKEMLQFAVTATQQVDIGLKLIFMEGIIEDLEEGESY